MNGFESKSKKLKYDTQKWNFMKIKRLQISYKYVIILSLSIDKTQDCSLWHVWVMLLAVKPGFFVYILVLYDVRARDKNTGFACGQLQDKDWNRDSWLFMASDRSRLCQIQQVRRNR